MDQFDKTTEIELDQISEGLHEFHRNCAQMGFKRGRNSVKESLKLALMVIDEVETAVVFKRHLEGPELLQWIHRKLIEAKAQIKDRGDWPLENK